MDTSAADLVLDENGFCNYCNDYLNELSDIVFQSENSNKENLKKFVSQIKKNGNGKRYDCIVGVSGGVDSSWALIKAKELGLRPLAVHMDNGWDSELAQNNIENLVNKLKVDLYTYVINWDEYRDLMESFLEADVLDVELLYDNAMLAVNYQQAYKYGLKNILGGYNKATEGMRMPPGWNWFKYDKKNIHSIAKIKGQKMIKTFPSFGTFDYIFYKYLNGINMHHFLDFFPYSKDKALEILETNFDYKKYPYKHYESIFTRFYQGYILPEKFSIDKRKVHFSTLIMSNQLKRDKAISLLKELPYPTPSDLQKDIDYFLKKMNWDINKLNQYLSRKEVPHDFYPSEKKLFYSLANLFTSIKNKLSK